MYACLICLILYSTNKILRAIVLLFYLNFFQSFKCDGNSIPFQLYWSIKGLIFDILWGSFLILSWFNATVIAYLKHSLPIFWIYCCFLLFYPTRRIYIWSTSIQTYFMKTIISSVSIPVIICTLSLFEFIIRNSPVSKEEIKVICIVNWIFHSPWALWLFIMSLKNGLIISR